MASETDQTIRTLEFIKEQRIDAPAQIVFESILEELGPANALPGSPMPMKLEAFPGGRWYRDLGNDAGHFWGVVQVIKPPTLLEISGPFFMSYPGVNHLQYKLKSDGNSTLLTLTHRGLGLIAPETITGVKGGWSGHLERIRKARGETMNVTDEEGLPQMQTDGHR